MYVRSSSTMSLLLAITLIFLSPILADTEIPMCDGPNSQIYCTGKILEAVSYWKLFPDSKNFTDRPLLKSPEETLADFKKEFDGDPSKIDSNKLEDFISEYFAEPGTELVDHEPEDWLENPPKIEQIADPDFRNWARDLNLIWKSLSKTINKTINDHPERYSLIYVPYPFIIPGGRFREFYYWDTYWAIKGLLVCGMHNTTQNMIRNLAYMVENYGFVPNGGRIYYLKRSQPPLLTAMLYEYYMATNDKAFVHEMLPSMLKEFEFWQNERSVDVHLADGRTFKAYQYHTKSNVPRPESYKEDVELAKDLPTMDEKRKLWTNVASTAESGWDFSTRWFGDHKNLSTVKTTQIIPVDLNAIIFWKMDILQFLFEIDGDQVNAKKFRELRQSFRWTMLQLFYNDTEGAWFDYHLDTQQHNVNFYPSVAVPLFTGAYQLLNKFKPERLFEYMNKTGALDFPGGIPASMILSGQQWDFPNGWGPLNHMVIEGLRKSRDPEMQSMAFKIARKWVTGNYRVFKNSTLMFEKYDVEKEIPQPGTGGEYVVQAGFGWTNGAVLDLLHTYGDRLKAPAREQTTVIPTTKAGNTLSNNYVSVFYLLSFLLLFSFENYYFIWQ